MLHVKNFLNKLPKLEAHHSRNDCARNEKERDKLSAIAGQVKAFTVNIQVVQMISHLPAGSLYFKQKLKRHQFTIYNIANGDVICYVQHEGVRGGGVDENVFAFSVDRFFKY